MQKNLWLGVLGIVLAWLAFGAAEAQTPGGNLTAYDDDGTILANGKRTIIIGTYAYTSKYAERPVDEAMKELADAGFNLVHTGTAPEVLSAAHEAGLMTWISVGTLDLKNREESEKKLRERVRAVKNQPAIAFLETVDEPAWTWLSPAQRVPAQALAEAYPIIKAEDPNHLLYTNHAPTNLVSTMRAYNSGTDVVAMDIYPVNPGGLRKSYALFEDGYQGDLNNTYISQVGEYVDKMRKVTGPNRPLFMVLQAFAWEMLREEGERDDAKILYPTYAQSRFMAFQALIKGANGIIYWGSHYTPYPSQCWTDIKRVVSEIAALAGPLAARRPPIDIATEYHEMGHSVDDGVQILAKRHDDALYLFTCNAYKNPCKATLSGLGDWRKYEVLNEDRPGADVENGAFTDEWEPFGVHVYMLTP